jgi:RNA polymerase sigma factor (sigma-70 family)
MTVTESSGAALVEMRDTELVYACNEGEPWAWEALVDRYRRLVYAIPLRVGLTEDDAADVFQTVFASLFEHLDHLRDPQCLAKWLIIAAQRESWSVARRRRRERFDEEASTILTTIRDGAALPEQRISMLADQCLVLEALARLGGRCRDLLWLLYYDPSEPSYAEVSKVLRMPLGSIGPTRARCLRKLRRIVEAMEVR